jgi:hypothetical protein
MDSALRGLKGSRRLVAGEAVLDVVVCAYGPLGWNIGKGIVVTASTAVIKRVPWKCVARLGPRCKIGICICLHMSVRNCGERRASMKGYTLIHLLM